MTQRPHRCYWSLLVVMLLLLPEQRVQAHPPPGHQERMITPQDSPSHVLQIHEITTGEIRPVNADTPAVIPNNGMLAFRLDWEPELIALPGSIHDLKWRLPISVMQMADGDGIKRTLQGEALLVGGWLVADGEVFSGTLKLRLADLEHPASQVQLKQPISIVVTANPGSSSPTDLLIKKANTYTDIEISTSLDPPFVKVSIIPAFDASPMHLMVPVMRRIVLRASPAKVQGFGLERTRISVSIKPPSEDPVSVLLSSSSGQPRPAEVLVMGAEPQYVTLRSQGTGHAILKAEATMTTTGSLQVDYVFPFNFLLAALIGGVIGSTLKARNRSDDQGSHPWVSFIISGIIVGYITAVAVILGFNPFLVTFVAKYGEALVFLVSCLGAYVGSPLIDQLARLRGSR